VIGMLWLWIIVFALLVAFAVYLLVLAVRGFIRGLRQGLDGDTGPERPSLRGMLFRTVLVTLLVLFLLWTVLLEHNQQDQRWPVAEGMFELSNAQSHGATWLDSEAQSAIEAALKEAVGGNPGSSGELRLGRAADLRFTPLSSAAVESLRRQGWVVGTGQVAGEPGDYVAWRTSKNRAVYYGWVTPPWYWDLFQYLVTLVFGIAILSPFAAVAAWHLNRRIVRPVQQVADASIVLADGSSPEPIPEKGPAELATMARSFNRLAERLDEAEVAQKAFVASVNHELKTPLTSLQGYGELLSDGAVSAEEAGPVVLAETARLERLVGDLLDAGRMDSGSFTVREEPVALDAVAAAVRQRYETVAEKFGISLEVRRAQAGEAVVLADEDRLVQVVGNLAENALRCIPAGGSVHVVVQPPATIRVEDNGPGLDAADLPHAFDRFYLYERCGKDRAVGTGLGLSIVKELTEAMGGTVTVASEAGEGTVFWVALRAAEGVLAAPATGASDGA
jgi:signal transduction histidine kinase